MGVIIKSIEFSLPKTKESLADLLKENPNWDVKKILSKTGIKNRYVSQNNEFNNVDLPDETHPIIPKFIVGCIMLNPFVCVAIIYNI